MARRNRRSKISGTKIGALGNKMGMVGILSFLTGRKHYPLHGTDSPVPMGKISLKRANLALSHARSFSRWRIRRSALSVWRSASRRAGAVERGAWWDTRDCPRESGANASRARTAAKPRPELQARLQDAPWNYRS